MVAQRYNPTSGTRTETDVRPKDFLLRTGVYFSPVRYGFKLVIKI